MSWVGLIALAVPGLASQETVSGPKPAEAPVGVVCHVKVVSDKVEDVSSLEAWRKSFLKPGMSDRDKGLAAWTSTVKFRHQCSPPREFLTEDCVHDPIKTFNVYGYGMCCCAASNVEALARAAGLRARGWGINGHDVSEVFWDGAWHLLDASLINYFPKPDGEVAGVEEIMAAVTEWLAKNPGYKGNDAKLRAFHVTDQWSGWKDGPALLAACPFYDSRGWLPARTHGWYSTMQEYDGTQVNGVDGKPFVYDHNGYSQGYQVNIQLRPGERLTRNWSHRRLHVNMKEHGCGALDEKVGDRGGSLVYAPQYGDLAPGRVGNGTLVYDVPVREAGWSAGLLSAENFEDARAAVKDPDRPAVLVLRMPSSYVYLTGKLIVRAAGHLSVEFSDNHGLDWKVIANGSGEVDLSPWVLRRYDYRLRLRLEGRGAALEELKVLHDVQHSQRALPALGPGTNTLTFSAGLPEGTLTLEASVHARDKGKQLVLADLHPRIDGFENGLRVGASGKAEVTFPVTTPGDLVRLRFGSNHRIGHARDGVDYSVSFDGGRTWKAAGRGTGPRSGNPSSGTGSDVPAGTRNALVRFAATSRDATIITSFRIDADYREPFAGFRPVKVTYRWEEDGQAKEDVHVARKPEETYTITCASKPVMKSILLELAE